MKKITSILAWILPIYLGMILIVSSIVLQNTFYKYLILSNFDANSNFTIVESNWHPLKPSIYLKDINLISKEQTLFIKDLWIEFFEQITTVTLEVGCPLVGILFIIPSQ